MLVAIGVDGAPSGWVAATLDATHSTALHALDDIEAVAALRGAHDVPVAIDVPIGLPEPDGRRACDAAARRILTGRSSAVFSPPARYLLAAAGDYPAMRALVEEERTRTPGAPSVSAQAAALAPKIAEVDRFARADPAREGWLFECHPELSFVALHHGLPLAGSKRTAAGLVHRLQLVRDRYPDAEERLKAATGVPLVDALDAYAALSTAARVARHGHSELGDGARDAEGLPMRIVV